MVRIEHLNTYSNRHEQALQKIEESVQNQFQAFNRAGMSQDSQIKVLEDRLHNVAVESNIAKNKQFADIKTRLLKCEEVLKLQSWNEERIKILNEQVRSTQR